MRLRCSVLLSQPYIISNRSEDGANITTKPGGFVMLSQGEVAIIRAEIERLEKALRECTDSGIRDRIKAWIDEEKKKLRDEDSK
jgi:hypothetical protein